MNNDKRTGYEESAKALTERAGGHFKNGDYELQDECLQCASMLHDMTPLAERAASNPASPKTVEFDGIGAASPAPVAVITDERAEMKLFDEWAWKGVKGREPIGRMHGSEAAREAWMARAALSSAPMAQAEPRPTDDELWDQTLRERDTYHEWADKLADAIATYFAVDIGEHSNQNCPWAEAFEAIEAATPAVPAAPSERAKGGAK